MKETVNLLKKLISIPSINPMGKEIRNSDRHYEYRICQYIEDYLKESGIEVIKQEVSKDRYNVGGIVRKGKEYPTIIFLSHLDTVDFEEEDEYLLNPVEKNGFIYGRGSVDAKGSLSCMLVALKHANENINKINKNIIVIGVADEEYQFNGVMKFLDEPLARGVDMGVVGEPTSCHIVYGLKGAARWIIEVNGKSCHSSCPEHGINAIYRMAKIVRYLERYNNEELTKITEPDMGRATLSVGAISGGIAVNVVAQSCKIEIDRRLLPGEEPDKARDAVTEYLRTQAEIDFEFTSYPLFTSVPAEKIEIDSSVVKLAKKACEDLGVKPVIKTVTYGSDQSRLIKAGISSIMFGPGDISVAHTNNECVSVNELKIASEVYMKLMEI